MRGNSFRLSCRGRPPGPIAAIVPNTSSLDSDCHEAAIDAQTSGSVSATSATASKNRSLGARWCLGFGGQHRVVRVAEHEHLRRPPNDTLQFHECAHL